MTAFATSVFKSGFFKIRNQLTNLPRHERSDNMVSLSNQPTNSALFRLFRKVTPNLFQFRVPRSELLSSKYFATQPMS